MLQAILEEVPSPDPSSQAPSPRHQLPSYPEGLGLSAALDSQLYCSSSATSSRQPSIAAVLGWGPPLTCL